MGLWLRWSWRDLRSRWVQVTAIALIIAIGTGVYAGMGSTTPWRRHALADSYALLNVFDLRVRLAEGSYAESGALLDAVRGIDHAAWIDAAEPRLIAPTFVRTGTDSGDLLVQGQLVGLDVRDAGPHVNGVHIKAGRALSESDSGQPVGVLDYHFAQYYDLPAQGQIELSGGVPLDTVGHGLSPEYFMVTTAEGGLMAQANFAVIFAPLETVQTLAGYPGMANDIVITLGDGADRDIVRAEIEAALGAAFPRIGLSLTAREDEPVYKLVNQSVGMNQEIYDLIAMLFLAGAMFGAFTLASRIVEAQRRQIGIGMALGMPPRLLMVRPLLVGAQIAILGAVFGLVLGVIIGKVAQAWIESVMPMPHTGRLFQETVFARAAVLGIVLPFVATLYPVWRAVRVTPVEAIRTGHLAAKGGGLPLAVMALPGRSFVQMPVRNLLRAPRRTIFTMLGIAASITIMIGMVGLLDSTQVILRRIKTEALQDHPARQTVYLNSFYPADDHPAASLDEIALALPVLRVPGQVSNATTDFEVLIEMLDLDNPLWTPTVIRGQRPSAGGILLAENAAHDLGVGVGDTITLEHPRRTGPFAFEIVRTPIPVTGLHADPWRTFVYLDRAQAEDLFGVAGLANLVYVDPAPGVSAEATKEALFALPAVTAVIPVQDAVAANQYIISEVTRFLSGVKLAAFALAFLIALNAASISLNEREREIATMFAFGLPVRTVTRMAMLENAITGALGTLAGIGLGVLVMAWFLTMRISAIMPLIRFPITLSAGTVITAVVMGVVVPALAPLVAVRRMARMDVSSALRVME